MGVVSGGAFLRKDDRRRVLFFTEGWSQGVVNIGMVTRGGQQRDGHKGWSIEGWSQGVVNRGMVTLGGQQRDGHIGWSTEGWSTEGW